MTFVMQASGLGKRYGRHWALRDAPSNVGACMANRGIRETITYQPASRYWPFQWIETGILLAVALALAGVCFWRLGRRRT